MASSPIPLTVSDPITAALIAAMGLGTEWFKYLQTPAGQQWAKDQNAIFEKLNAQVSGFFDHLPGADCGSEGGRVGDFMARIVSAVKAVLPEVPQ